jgi:SHS family lactate transporter-like MFS transporter
MPLALEHWPTHLRGIASGLLQGGYAMGYLCSAIVYQFIYPIARDQTTDGWRILLWIGILPACLVPWIRLRVKESPIWLERQRYLHDSNQRQTMPLWRLFTGDLRAITIQTTLLMGAQLFLYNAIAPLYPTFLNQRGLQPLVFVVAFNAGGIGGALLFGRLSEGRLGRRGAAALATVVGLAAIPLYVFAQSTTWLVVGAGAMGLFGTGNFGVVPGYLNERFPTAARAAGAGFSYQAGAALAAFCPALIGWLVDGGMPLASAMAWCMALSSVLLIALLALGPETRGRVFQASN